MHHNLSSVDDRASQGLEKPQLQVSFVVMQLFETLVKTICGGDHVSLVAHVSPSKSSQKCSPVVQYSRPLSSGSLIKPLRKSLACLSFPIWLIWKRTTVQGQDPETIAMYLS
jgi:hypothetical protein